MNDYIISSEHQENPKKRWKQVKIECIEKSTTEKKSTPN